MSDSQKNKYQPKKRIISSKKGLKKLNKKHIPNKIENRYFSVEKNLTYLLIG